MSRRSWPSGSERRTARVQAVRARQPASSDCTPARVATYAYVNPVVAVLAGWLLLGESLQLRILLAIPVLIGGVVVITTAGMSGRARAAAADIGRNPALAPTD